MSLPVGSEPRHGGGPRPGQVRAAGPAGPGAVAAGAAGRPGLVDRLRDRFGHLVHELSRFGTVGAVSYLVDLTVFNILRNETGPIPAKVVSTVVAATLAFAGNKLWTWRHREHANLTRAYSLYFFFNAVGLATSLVCLWLSHDVLGEEWPHIFRTRLADNISAMVVGMTLGTVFRFWSYRTFVFVARETPSVAAPSATTDRHA